MISRAEHTQAINNTIQMLQKAGLVFTEDELKCMEIADFGLSDLTHFGAQILTLVDTAQIGVKVIVNFPLQTEPEHTHVRIGDYTGKEETIRCAWGVFYLYTPGEETQHPEGIRPSDRQAAFTALCEHILHPGDQVTLVPGTPHWFQGGPEGSVIWSFSTKVFDAQDHFSDPQVHRKTIIKDEK